MKDQKIGVIVEITETLTKHIFVPDATSVEDGEQRVRDAYDDQKIILDAECMDGCAEFSSREVTSWDHEDLYETIPEMKG